jgi:putative salt-induced outer membrane protein YdiY
MSRIKKAVLFILAVFVLVIITMPVQAKGSAKIGGTFVNSDDATFKVAYDSSTEKGNWQRALEVDYMYQTQSDVESTNELYLNHKLIYSFAPKHYIVSTSSYDIDKFRTDEQRISMALGYGYKLLRTEKFKASNEFSIGYLTSDLVDEIIYRNSLWFFYKLSDKVNFTNKYLVEFGDEAEDYVRNETSLNYNFDNGLVLGITNTYTEDPIDNNILGVTIGVKW